VLACSGRRHCGREGAKAGAGLTHAERAEARRAAAATPPGAPSDAADLEVLEPLANVDAVGQRGADDEERDAGLRPVIRLWGLRIRSPPIRVPEAPAKIAPPAARPDRAASMPRLLVGPGGISAEPGVPGLVMTASRRIRRP
jgi:hypothetical protein